MKIWRDLIILFSIFGIIWLAFTWRPISLPDADLAISEDREKELSELIMKDLKNSYTFYPDSITDRLIHPITKRLLDSLNDRSYDYKFHLINNDSQVNAFATLDGHVFIFSGLVKFVDNPEQLAGIIAHEIGHHENGDVVDRLLKELGLGVIAAVISGGDPLMVAEISKLLVSSGFDRKQEREADLFAYELMIKCQISPARLAHFFTKLKSEDKAYPDELEIIMTHPNSKNRIEDALSYQLPSDFSEVAFDLNWEELVKKTL